MTGFRASLDAALERQQGRALAETIWTASRADESTISATGANVVARAVLSSGWFADRLAEARAERDAEWRARIDDITAIRCAEARAQALAPIREFHDRWGSADVEELDQLALWEDLGRLLRAGGADV